MALTELWDFKPTDVLVWNREDRPAFVIVAQRGTAAMTPRLPLPPVVPGLGSAAVHGFIDAHYSPHATRVELFPLEAPDGWDGWPASAPTPRGGDQDGDDETEPPAEDDLSLDPDVARAECELERLREKGLA
jgi:hypothetical protein